MKSNAPKTARVPSSDPRLLYDSSRPANSELQSNLGEYGRRRGVQNPKLFDRITFCPHPVIFSPHPILLSRALGEASSSEPSWAAWRRPNGALDEVVARSPPG